MNGYSSKIENLLIELFMVAILYQLLYRIFTSTLSPTLSPTLVLSLRVPSGHRNPPTKKGEGGIVIFMPNPLRGFTPAVF